MLLSAIFGDIVGSTHELDGIKTKDFELIEKRSTFTDDTVVMLGTALALMHPNDDDTYPFTEKIRALCNAHTNLAYGKEFKVWLRAENPKPYGSWGSGGVIRGLPIGEGVVAHWDLIKTARAAAEISHNHASAVAGAIALAQAVSFLAEGRNGKDHIMSLFASKGYDMDRTVDSIRGHYEVTTDSFGSFRSNYGFTTNSAKIVPEAAICFLESTSTIDAIRNAVSLGGDGDTLACIAGGLAGEYYTHPSRVTDADYKEFELIFDTVIKILPKHLLQLVFDFQIMRDDNENMVR